MKSRLESIWTQVKPRIKYLLPLLGLVSFGLLLVTPGFYFTYYAHTYTFVVNTEVDASKVREVANKTYYSQLDISAGSVRYQNLSDAKLSEYKAIYDQEIPEQYSLIESTQFLPNDINTKIALGIVTVFAANILFVYFFAVRSERGLSRRNIFVFNTINLTNAILSMLLTIGLVNVISRLYELNDLTFVSLTLVGFTNLGLAFWISAASTKYLPEGLILTIDVSSSIVRDYFGKLVATAAFVLLTLSIGLGTKAVIPAIVILAGSLFTYLVYVYMPRIWIAEATYWRKVLSDNKSKRKSSVVLNVKQEAKKSTKTPKDVRKPAKRSSK